MPIPCAGPRDITSCGHRTITRPRLRSRERRRASGSRGGAAATAELGAGRQLRAAAGAEYLRVRDAGRGDGLAAAGAELGARGELRAAARALAGDAVLRVRIETLDLIDAAELVLR